MKKNKKILILILLIIIIIILFLIFSNISFEKTDDNEISDYTPEEEISDEQLRETTITLYFQNVETGEIQPEGQLIDSNQLIKNPYLTIIQKLIDGPTSETLCKVFPENTRILEASIEENCVTLNFSEELLNYENDDKKYLIINCILNSLTQLNEVNSVKILINGEINENLPEEYFSL